MQSALAPHLIVLEGSKSPQEANALFFLNDLLPKYLARLPQADGTGKR